MAIYNDCFLGSYGMRRSAAKLIVKPTYCLVLMAYQLACYVSCAIVTYKSCILTTFIDTCAIEFEISWYVIEDSKEWVKPAAPTLIT